MGGDAKAESGEIGVARFCQGWSGSVQGFHGTNANFDPRVAGFKTSMKGTLGRGLYLATKREHAAEYGSVVHECEVLLTNPWVIDLDPDSATCLERDFECAALDAVLGLEGGEALAQAAQRDESGHFDGSLTDKLIGMGYDGVVGTYLDGSMEIVAFYGDQVRIHSAGGLPEAMAPEGSELGEERGQHVGLMLAGAAEFLAWGQALPDDVGFGGASEALKAFAAHLAGVLPERSEIKRLVVPPDWIALPREPDAEMLKAFQVAFMTELRKRKGRTRTAEEAGMLAMLKHEPDLPEGWIR